MSGELVIVNLAVALGATATGGNLSDSEKRLASAVASLPKPEQSSVDAAREEIRSGRDPLGKMLYALRSPVERRGTGTVYTPDAIVAPMVNWVLAQNPQRVVDAGTGSGRYLGALLRANPDLPVVAVDLDPLATIMARATAAALEATKARVVNADFTRLTLPPIAGMTAFIGNPPYLRHHQMTAATKQWGQRAAADLGTKLSGLAGLHAYFFLATAKLGRPGDIGCYVTSAEWLDVNYGAIVRSLLTHDLGGEQIHVIEPEAEPFEGTATTAAITQFRMGPLPKAIGFRSVPTLSQLGSLETTGNPVARERLVESTRWSTFIRTRTQVPEGYIELGELARVHRGAVTGANGTWVSGTEVLLPESVLYPSVTRARELFAAGSILATVSGLRNVIDIPADLDVFDVVDRKLIDAFLRQARRSKVHSGYVAKNRRAWWSVGLRKPAPILATYMARRPPAFVRNKAEARHINIAHGVYPREQMTELAMQRLADSLSSSVSVAQGRTYAGGLTKFEPREMERLPVPDLATLMSNDHFATAMG